MKKVLLFTVFSCLSIICFAQKGIDTCQLIETKTDKFTKAITHSFKTESIILEKWFYNKEPHYSAMLFTTSEVMGTLRGAKILLSNDELVADSKAEVHYKVLEDGKFLVIVSLKLSSMDIPSMLKYPITDIQLGSISKEVKDGELVKKILDCLLKK